MRPKCVRNGSKWYLTGTSGLSGGFRASQSSYNDHWKAGGSVMRPPRLAAYSKVPRPTTPAERPFETSTFGTIYLNIDLFYRGFLLRTAAQL